MKKHIQERLECNDLRSKGEDKFIIDTIQSQQDFDEVFEYFFNYKKVFANRAADACQKISVEHPEYLKKHRKKILKELPAAINIELRWNLALMIPRLKLNEDELGMCWDILRSWATDRNGSRIVRTVCIQSLYELLPREELLKEDFLMLLEELESEKIPSVNARIRHIRKWMGKDSKP